MHRSIYLLAIACFFVVGCSQQEGSQRAAENYLSSEVRKWQAGETNDAILLDTLAAEPPIGFEIYSTSPCDPSLMASTDRSNPAFQIKVKSTWISKAGTQLTRSHTYKLTWLQSERRWHIER